MDKHEQQIHNAFSAIAVDESGFENKLDFTTTKTKKLIKLPKIVAAVIIIGFLSVGTVYATGNGWSFLQNIFGSGFTELVVDQGGNVYAYNQGMRIEIIGAEQIDETLLLVFSIQDVDDIYGFNYDTWPMPQFSVTSENSVVMMAIFQLNFDAETRTFYLQGFLEGLGIVADAEILTLHIPSIWLFPHSRADAIYGDWTFELNVSDTIHPTITLENVEFSANGFDFVLDYIRIGPVAVHMQGVGHSIASRNFIVEVGDDQISMWGSGGSGNNVRLSPVEPIDVENVTAIILNGVRIPID
jgi:hypothetical protein